MNHQKNPAPTPEQVDRAVRAVLDSAPEDRAVIARLLRKGGFDLSEIESRSGVALDADTPPTDDEITREAVAVMLSTENLDDLPFKTLYAQYLEWLGQNYPGAAPVEEKPLFVRTMRDYLTSGLGEG